MRLKLRDSTLMIMNKELGVKSEEFGQRAGAPGLWWGGGEPGWGGVFGALPTTEIGKKYKSSSK